MWNQEIADSKYDAAWVAKVNELYAPLQLKAKNGDALGVYRFFGRVSWPAMYIPTKMEGAQGDVTYNSVCMFTPGYDLSILKAAIAAKSKENPKWVNGTPAHWKDPFRPAELKAGKKGYVPGTLFTTVTAPGVDSKTKAPRPHPRIITAHEKPITDQTEIYPGCWGFFVGNTYNFDKTGNAGTKFGFDMFIKMYDDNPLGGGSLDTATAMAGISIPMESGPDATDYSKLMG